MLHSKNIEYIDKNQLIDDLIPIFNRLSPKDKGDIMEIVCKQEVKVITNNKLNQCGEKTIPDERTFVFTDNNTKQDLLNFFTKKKGCGTFYVNVENEELLVLEFAKSTPVKYDIHYLEESSVMQVSLKEMVDIVNEYCTNVLRKEDKNIEKE